MYLVYVSKVVSFECCRKKRNSSNYRYDQNSKNSTYRIKYLCLNLHFHWVNFLFLLFSLWHHFVHNCVHFCLLVLLQTRIFVSFTKFVVPYLVRFSGSAAGFFLDCVCHVRISVQLDASRSISFMSSGSRLRRKPSSS